MVRIVTRGDIKTWNMRAQITPDSLRKVPWKIEKAQHSLNWDSELLVTPGIHWNYPDSLSVEHQKLQNHSIFNMRIKNNLTFHLYQYFKRTIFEDL